MSQIQYAVAPTADTLIPVAGTNSHFPVHRIYCVGKNYAAHVVEMGSDPERQSPCFFMKPADAVVVGDSLTFPSRTDDLHYEAELVIALGRDGTDINPATALDHVFGYAVGLDMTRRDLQAKAVKASKPWDTAKGFDHSAPISAIHPVSQSGHFSSGKIQLWLNDQLRQDADLADMIWKQNEIIAELSTLFTLKAGDLIFTGTPAGVGAVAVGDVIRATVEGLDELTIRIL